VAHARSARAASSSDLVRVRARARIRVRVRVRLRLRVRVGVGARIRVRVRVTVRVTVSVRVLIRPVGEHVLHQEDVTLRDGARVEHVPSDVRHPLSRRRLRDHAWQVEVDAAELRMREV